MADWSRLTLLSLKERLAIHFHRERWFIILTAQRKIDREISASSKTKQHTD